MSNERDFSGDFIDVLKNFYETDDENAAINEARTRFVKAGPDERRAFVLNLKEWAECEEQVSLRERGTRHKLHQMFTATNQNLKRLGR